MKKTMKAVVVQAPMDFGLEEVPVPDLMPGGFLLEVEACGLCGSDLRTLRMGHRAVTLPFIIGHETCGIITETAPDYTGQWKVGEQVAVGPVAYCGRCEFCLKGVYELCENQREIAQYWPGAFAEYLAVPGECVSLGNILSVPKGVDPAHAAVIEPISSSINAQEKANLGLGETVAILGCGPVGCIHAALARIRGASKIIMTDIDQNRLDLASAFEPDLLIDVSKRDAVESILQNTDGKGTDIVISASPSPVASVQAIDMAKKGGRILLFGGLPKNNSVVKADFNTIHYRGLHLIGTTTFAPRHNRTALQLVAAGIFPIEKLISHRFSLSDFNRGAGLALDGKVLKGVFIPDRFFNQ
jgi:L-iditol 2-dehydrogenase